MLANIVARSFGSRVLMRAAPLESQTVRAARRRAAATARGIPLFWKRMFLYTDNSTTRKGGAVQRGLPERIILFFIY